MTYTMSADLICRNARALQAGRICFKVGSSFIFSNAEDPDLADKVLRAASGRVKYQREENGRWQDCSGYEFVTDSKILFRDLAEDVFRGTAKCTKEEFSIALNLNPHRYRSALRRILRILHDRTAKSYDHRLVDRVINSMEPFRAFMVDEYSQYFDGYLRAMHLLFVSGLSAVVKEPTRDAVEALVQRLDATRDVSVGNPPESGHLATMLFRAKLLSLTDRKSAAAEFRSLRTRDVSRLVQFFYIDMGSFTYFAEEDIGAELESHRTAIIDSVAPVRKPRHDARTAIALGADVNFFRIYGSMMMFYAQQLPEYDFVFILCAEHNVAVDEERAARAYMDSLAEFNRSGVPENIQFYHAPVPEFVVDIRTFYATARFFAASKLLTQYSSLYLIDIDLQFSDNPREFIEWLSKREFGCSDNQALYRLSPWRRYLAGNVFISNRVRKQFLVDLQTYIVRGLLEQSSWMLDQNALSYAIERNFVDENVSTAAFGTRPSFQPKFRSDWEANYARTDS